MSAGSAADYRLAGGKSLALVGQLMTAILAAVFLGETLILVLLRRILGPDSGDLARLLLNAGLLSLLVVATVLPLALRIRRQHLRQARNEMDEARQSATRGGELMAQVMQQMNDIQHSARRIGEITGVIDGIAFQTNILALNAAVEAAIIIECAN